MTAHAQVLALDEEWFDEHPAATAFHRPLTGDEIAAYARLTADHPDDGRWWMRVVCVDRDRRVYAHRVYRRAAQ